MTVFRILLILITIVTVLHVFFDYCHILNFIVQQKLLEDLFQRLSLKERKFKVFPPASQEAQDELWSILGRYGDPVNVEKHQGPLKKALKSRYTITMEITFIFTFLANIYLVLYFMASN